MKISKPMLTCLAKIALGDVYRVTRGQAMAEKAEKTGLAIKSGRPAFWTLTDAGRDALRQAGMLEDHKEAAE